MAPGEGKGYGHLGWHSMPGWPYDNKSLHRLLAVPRISAYNCLHLPEIASDITRAQKRHVYGTIVEMTNQVRSMPFATAEKCATAKLPTSG